MVENRPQTFLSRFLTTKSVVSGEPKIVRCPYGTVLYLSRPFMNRNEKKFHPRSVSLFHTALNAQKLPKMAKIVEIGAQKLDLGVLLVENRNFF